MALKGKFPIAPGTRPDPRFETTYDPKKGGYYPAREQSPKEYEADKKDGRKAS